MVSTNLSMCENGVMYYLKDAKADFFKMMELVETVKF